MLETWGAQLLRVLLILLVAWLLQAIASRLVKEIALLGGDVAPFTTPQVAKALIKRCKEKR